MTLAAPLTLQTARAPAARLAAVATDRERVVSCYVALEPVDRTRRAYLKLLKGQITELEAELPSRDLDPAAQADVRRDLARILALLVSPKALPRTRGLAIFACSAEGLFEVLPLPRVYRTRVDLAHRPLLQELVAAEEGFRPAVVAVLDRGHGRYFEVSARGARELPGLASPAIRGGRFRGDQSAPGWGEHHYHARVEEEKHRHYAAIVDNLGRLVRERPGADVILAGPQEHTRAAARFLPPSLAERLAGTVRLNPTAVTEAEVYAATLDLRAEAQDAREEQLVTRMEEAVGSGWAVNGARDTLRALARGQLRVLLVPVGQRGAGFRCARSGRLVLARHECRSEGDPVPVRHLVDQAIQEALRQRVEVVVLRSGDAQSRVDGMAGLLRFRR